MSRTSLVLTTLALALATAVPARAATLKCPADSVKAGNVCIDKYEASVWGVDISSGSGKSLAKKIEQGKATLADLTKAGAIQLGCTDAPFSFFPLNLFFTDAGGTHLIPGEGTSFVAYAVSIPGVLPSTCVTWFQANQLCLLSGKRLLTNREWQGAATGTPDPGTDNGTSDCNIFEVGGRWAGEYRLAVGVQVELGRIRHGRQRVRVGGGLGSSG